MEGRRKEGDVDVEAKERRRQATESERSLDDDVGGGRRVEEGWLVGRL